MHAVDVLELVTLVICTWKSLKWARELRRKAGTTFVSQPAYVFANDAGEENDDDEEEVSGGAVGAGGAGGAGGVEMKALKLYDAEFHKLELLAVPFTHDTTRVLLLLLLLLAADKNCAYCTKLNVLTIGGVDNALAKKGAELKSRFRLRFDGERESVDGVVVVSEAIPVLLFTWILHPRSREEPLGE